MRRVSRLRRLFVTGKIFFVTCNVLRDLPTLNETEFEILARVFQRVRQRRGFLLSGYVFMPDHWHALIYPAQGDTLPRLMGALKIASNQASTGLDILRTAFGNLGTSTVPSAP